MRPPEHKKHCFVYVFLAFFATRTQQTLLLRCFLALNIPEHNTSYYYNVFLLFIIPEHKHIIVAMHFLLLMLPEHKQVINETTFLTFMFPEHKQLYVVNVFHVCCCLLFVERLHAPTLHQPPCPPPVASLHV